MPQLMHEEIILSVIFNAPSLTYKLIFMFLLDQKLLILQTISTDTSVAKLELNLTS